MGWRANPFALRPPRWLLTDHSLPLTPGGHRPRSRRWAAHRHDRRWARFVSPCQASPALHRRASAHLTLKRHAFPVGPTLTQTLRPSDIIRSVTVGSHRSPASSSSCSRAGLHAPRGLRPRTASLPGPSCRSALIARKGFESLTAQPSFPSSSVNQHYAKIYVYSDVTYGIVPDTYIDGPPRYPRQSRASTISSYAPHGSIPSLSPIASTFSIYVDADETY